MFARCGAVLLLALGACGGDTVDQTITVCARGDRDLQKTRLHGGTLLFTFRDDAGQRLGGERASADDVSTVPAIPDRAAVVEVRGIDEGGSDVSVGTAEIDTEGACICLSFVDDTWICDGVACSSDGETCEFVPAEGLEPCAQKVADGTTLDDSGPCFETGGTPEYIRDENVGFEDTLRWTHATDNPLVDNYGLWRVEAAQAGTYRIEAFTLAGFGASRTAVYEILHGRDVTRTIVDQSAADGWNVIGEFTFEEGGAQAVRLPDNTGEPASNMVRLVFDALRFTQVE